MRFEVVNNLKDTDWYQASIFLHNTGNETIGKSNWEIYASIIRLIQPEQFPYPNGAYLILSSGLRVRHIAGTQYKFENDDATFQPIAPGQEIRLELRIQYWQVSRYEAMPNWYVTAEGRDPKVIKSTSGEGLNFMQPFSTKEQWKRYSDDVYNPYTAEVRYDRNADIADLGKSESVIPTPLAVVRDDTKTMTLSACVIVNNTDFYNEIAFLAGEFITAIELITGTKLFI